MIEQAVESIESERHEDAGSESGESHYATRVAAPPRAGWKTAIRAIGWTLVVAGAVLLEFAAFVVWGTNAQTAREQDRLRREFDAAIAPVAGGGVASQGPARKYMQPEVGQALARLRIPALGVDAVVVEGVGHEELKLGPGHIPETALPGRRGSAVISGHRTTYGAPFGDLDRLEVGSEILVSTLEGETRYVVSRSYVVFPEDTSVTAPLKPGEKPRLRLTTCHPRFSAARRLIVEAELASTPTDERGR